MRTVDPARIRTPRDLAPYLDHTVLSPGASAADVARALRRGAGARLRRRSACTRSTSPRCGTLLAGTAALTIAVVDFPRGEGTPAARASRRPPRRCGAGAEELDVVLAAAGAARRPLRGACSTTCARVVRGGAGAGEGDPRDGAAHARPEGRRRGAVARCAGAAFVKTSTGFGGGGATVEDVALLRAVVGDALGVKASGGVRTAAQALAMIRAGASRVGASACVAIVPRGLLISRSRRRSPARARAVRIRAMDRRRFVILVADSVGCGALPDARAYGDEGSDTLGNTSRAVGRALAPRARPHGARAPHRHPRRAAGSVARRVPRPDGGALARARTPSPVTGR